VVNIDVTISIGVRYMDPGASQAHPDKEEIISQADRALYVSKKQGRDRATLWHGNMPKD
jgi:GGDEF domain-containing protein